MTKTTRGNVLDDTKLYFEKLPNDGKKVISLARDRGRTAVRATGAALSKSYRKLSGLARFRLLKRLNQHDKALQYPFVYDDEHNLEGYIRHIVRDEIVSKKRGRRGTSKAKA